LNGLIIASIGFLLLLCSINQINDINLTRIVFWGLPSSLIVFGLVYAKQFNNALLKYLGDASYSIYLIHPFIISAFYKLITLLSITTNHDLLAIIALFLSVSCGAFMYSYIEKPMTLFIKLKLT